MTDLENKIKILIISSLKLEGISPEDIGSDEPLFGSAGLALDSIDALELGVAIRKTFGIRIETVSEEIKQHFASVSALANFIRLQEGAK